jgi:hypothetical protein
MVGLSSLQFLLSILKYHKETVKISPAKMQALRKEKEVLSLTKQQYKRQRVAECTSYTQEHGNVCKFRHFWSF